MDERTPCMQSTVAKNRLVRVTPSTGSSRSHTTSIAHAMGKPLSYRCAVRVPDGAPLPTLAHRLGALPSRRASLPSHRRGWRSRADHRPRLVARPAADAPHEQAPPPHQLADAKAQRGRRPSNQYPPTLADRWVENRESTPSTPVDAERLPLRTHLFSPVRCRPEPPRAHPPPSSGRG